MKVNRFRQKQIKIVQQELNKTRLFFGKIRSISVRKCLNRTQENLKLVVEMLDNYDKDLQMIKLNNRYLAQAIQNEKEHSKSLLQDKIVAESSYQDLLREHINLKKDLRNMEQIIINYDEELKNSMIPNLVRLSDDITKFKLKNNILRKNIETKGNNGNSFPKNSWSGNINFNTSTNQPVSTVNPMIKGCVIQKPTINVRRVSFPHESRSSFFANVGISSPILEEPEENLEPVNNLNRKCKNGLRHMINLSNRQVSRRPVQSVPVTDINYCNGSGDDGDDINFKMEPVVRLRDVTRLLQNSTLQISETETDGSSKESNYTAPVPNHYSPEVLLTRVITPKNKNYDSLSSENPLEGCSWMYQGASTNTCECGIQISSTHKCSVNLWDKSHKNLDMDQDKINLPVEVNVDTDVLLQEDNVEKSRTPISFAAENLLEMKKENRKSETTFMSSTLNTSSLLKSSKKKFFLCPSLNDDAGKSPDGNHENMEIPVKTADPSAENDVQCTSTSVDTDICNNVNLEIPPMLLQNCTIRQKRSRFSAKPSCIRLTGNEKYLRDSLQVELQNNHLDSREQDVSCGSASMNGDCQQINLNHDAEVVSSGMLETYDERSQRPKRKNRMSHKNYYEYDDSAFADDCEYEDNAPKKRQNKSNKEVADSTSTERTRKSSAFNTKGKKRSRTPVNETVSHYQNGRINESNVTANETLETDSSSRKSTRPLRSARHKQNVSYKEPNAREKLRRN